MTDQIKSSQIIPARQVRQNPTQAAPRDLVFDYSVDTGVGNSVENFLLPTQETPAEASTSIIPTSVTDANKLDTPMYQSIKTQAISYQGDGSIAVDVVIVVTDIIGASEYEIRITKD